MNDLPVKLESLPAGFRMGAAARGGEGDTE
jgi:hypothetical protein